MRPPVAPVCPHERRQNATEGGRDGRRDRRTEARSSLMSVLGRAKLELPLNYDAKARLMPECFVEAAQRKAWP